MLSLLTNGCLLGPDVQGEPEETLHAPKIITDQLNPPAGGTTDFRIVDCDSLKFDVRQVSDKNINDVLYGRWFVDYDADDYESSMPKEFFLTPNGSVTRGSATNPRLSFTLRKTYFTSADEGDQHTVMVVIADRVFSTIEGIGFKGTPDEQEGQYDLWQWTVRFSNTGYCEETQ